MPQLTEQDVRRILREELSNLIFSDRYMFQKNLQIADGRNIQLALGTGTKIGTATTQKLGFYNVTPVIQQTVDGQAVIDLTSVVAVCSDLRAKLKTVGIITF